MIKRYLFDELKAHLNQKEISLIVGPRQAGKTTLLYDMELPYKFVVSGSGSLELNIYAEGKIIE